MTEYSIADLELINFKSWDEALDFYNKVKANHSDLTFEIWYEQQKNYIALKEKQLHEKENTLHELHINENENLLDILQKLFHSIHIITKDDFEEEEDEYDKWIEDDDEDLPF